MNYRKQHLEHLITCDEFGNKPYLRGIQNHMKLAPLMMELWSVVQEQQALFHIPDVDEVLKKLDRKLEEMYGRDTPKNRRAF